MSVVIHKQRLALDKHQTLILHGKVLTLLDIQLQDEHACLWYEIEHGGGPSVQTEVHVQVVGTGFHVPEYPFAYLSTTQVGMFVWHWYVKVEYPA